MVDHNELAKVRAAGILNHGKPTTLQISTREGIQKTGTLGLDDHRAEQALAGLIPEMTMHVVHPFLLIRHDIPLKNLSLARFHIGIGIG